MVLGVKRTAISLARLLCSLMSLLDKVMQYKLIIWLSLSLFVLYFGIFIGYVYYIGGLILFFVWIFRPKLVLGCLVSLLIAFSSFELNQLNIDADKNFEKYVGEWVNIRGAIKNTPYQKGLRKNFIIGVDQLVSFDGSVNKIENVNIQFSMITFDQIVYGDLVEASVLVERPYVSTDFDYARYLSTKKVGYTVDQVYDFRVISAHRNPLVGTSNYIRKRVVEKVRGALREPHAGLVLGMLIGTREEFPQEFEEALRDTGTTHVIAVSGYNVNIIIILLLAQAGKFPRSFIRWGLIVVLLLFIFIVGIDNTPALRATIMGFAVLLGDMIGRKGSVLASLLFSGGVMALQNPNIIFSISYQLSFVATLGMVLLTDSTKIFLSFLPDSIKEEFVVSCVAMVVTMPITLYHFGVVPILSVLANVLVANLIPIIMICGVAFIIVSGLHPLVFLLMQFVLWSSVNIFVVLVNFLSRYFSYSFVVEEGDRALVSSLVIIVVAIGFLAQRFYMDKGSHYE